MIKKVIAAFALALSVGSAFAAVDVNTANTDALRGIKGIGPAKAKAILDERDAHGPFKDAAEMSKRVKGMGGKTMERLQAEGLTIGPASKTAAAAHAGSGALAANAATAAASAHQPVVVKK
ncbi:ComEA family DNA-binding protein [Caballeronia humi]|uniref:DNA-binding protein n=1 Tax=Caballeronia humi TaxID=326474 RepID=A0A158H2R2_9BURK|nr:helix-hairpin-helix domain-containing protein [Caballeronia humi]SAL38050.1 DNA-binding protein [Caballeronia humi]